MNICGCLVHVAGAAVASARDAIAAIDGVEIYGEGADGRFVVVVEDTDTAFASDQIMAIHQVRGVISVTLNYHHFEDLSQPVPHAHPSCRRTDA